MFFNRLYKFLFGGFSEREKNRRIKFRKEAKKWLDDKWPENKRICECCGRNRWHIYGNTHELSKDFNCYIPVIVLLCTNCANLKLFSAIEAGIKKVDYSE
jgi:hypothetical protein